jgi:uncharacterized caspase-like protein
MANQDDWAIVVGVQHYPGLSNSIGANDALKGPVNDAIDFHQWVVDPQGAAVPPAQARLFIQTNLPLSGSALPPLTPREIISARPNILDIQAMLFEFTAKAAENRQKGLGQQVGRRLYIFLAGHGIEPGIAFPGIFPGPALLLANCTAGDYSQHVLGRQLANWFYLCSYFKEVLLFMDCCRDNTWTTPARPLATQPCNGTDLGKYFYAFGAKWDRRSREQDFGGVTHGIFTTALLDALRGGASDPITQKVTIGSLRDCVPQIMEELAPNRVDPQRPDFEPLGDDFVVCVAPPKLYPVTIALPSVAVGNKFKVHGYGSKTYYNDIPELSNLPLNLPRGLYSAVIAAGNDIKTADFAVPFKNPIHFD